MSDLQPSDLVPLDHKLTEVHDILLDLKEALDDKLLAHDRRIKSLERKVWWIPPTTILVSWVILTCLFIIW